MILDLMRNDLSKTAIKGSVRVEELCKVYTFNQVHQMISTVTSQIDKNMHPVDVIKSTFPMGSMTGAPKISAMKIIEELEETKRGLYSGAVGYFSPEGDFDFNVGRDFVATCQVPMLVLMGNDAYHPMQTSREIAEIAPKATLIEDWKSEPDNTARSVIAFLQRHP